MFKPQVNIGDRFVKVGPYQRSVWVVTRLLDTVKDVPHACLEKADDRSDTITVSVRALSDGEFFRRA